MGKHLIVCGHGQGDPGAMGNGYGEASFTRNNLKPAIEKYARQLKNNTIVFYDTSKDMFQQTNAGGGANIVSGYDSVTEFHLDANNSPLPTGGHVIVAFGFNADKYDLAIAKVIQKYVGWWGSVQKASGMSYRNNLLNLNVFARRGISYRLVELGFITNPNDISKIVKNLDAMAKEFVEAITGEKLSGSAPAPSPAPTPTPAPPASNNNSAKATEWAESGSFTISSDAVNLRTDHSTSAGVIATLKKGAVVKYDRVWKAPNNYIWIRQKRSNGYAWLATGQTNAANARINYWGTFK